MKLDYKPLRDLIARHESESSAEKQGVPSGYDVCSWFIPRDQWPQYYYDTLLTEMSVADVLRWQKACRKRGVKSSAAGRYQIIHDTLESLSWGDVRFHRATQDKLCDQLLKRRGADDWENALITDGEFGDNLAREWAALPLFYPANGNQPGESYYDGDGLNKAGVTCEEVLHALDLVRLSGDVETKPEIDPMIEIAALTDRVATLEDILKGFAYGIGQELGE